VCYENITIVGNVFFLFHISKISYVGVASIRHYFFQISIVLCLLKSSEIFARKTNHNVWQDDFDLSAGGASLSLATQEGMLFANPAQLPIGGKLFRWLGLKSSFFIGEQSVALFQSFRQKTEEEESNMSSKIFEKSIHFGTSYSFSFITNNLGIVSFFKLAPEAYTSRYGIAGMPQLKLSGELYGGVVVGGGFRLPKIPWLSLGVGLKYLIVSEPEIIADISSLESLKNIQDPEALQKHFHPGQGLGLDLGMLFFFPGSSIDYRLSIKLDNLGGTYFRNADYPSSFKQTFHIGTGVTFHQNSSAIHLALDYRDITNAYKEEWFKKLYMGVKTMIQTYLGVGLGLYQGYLSYGVEIDLIFLRLAAVHYTEETGEHPGVKPRSIYQITLATGFNF